MKSIPSVLAIFFVFSIGLTQAAPGIAPDTPNTLGLYADVGCGAEFVDVPPFATVDMYLVVTHPYNYDLDRPITYISGVEFAIPTPTNATILGFNWPVDVVDVGTGINHIVGFSSNSPVPVAGDAAVLCTIEFIYTSATSAPAYFHLAPATPSSSEGYMACLDAGDEGNIIELSPPYDLWDSPIFGVNTGPLWNSGQIVIDVEPDASNAPWSLNSLEGFHLTGSGDHVIPAAPAGTYVLSWGDVPGYTSPDLNPQAQILNVGETITFIGEYIGPGEVIIQPEPASISAPWTLEKPDGSTLTGNGPQTYADMVPGDYTLTWGDVTGWITPAPNPQTMTLESAQAITFAGQYTPIGEIYVDVEPDFLGASWTLTGPDGFSEAGNGDATYGSPVTGDFTLTVDPIPGWILESENPQTLTLEYQGTISFLAEFSPGPLLTSVADIPNDQGRQVRLVWDRCGYDAPGYPYLITEYGVYRQQNDKSGSGRLAGWDFIGSVPARGDDVYQFVAPTLCDSTVAGGMCQSTFMVSAMTESPFVYFDSDPMSGFSVDNLNPVQPGGFAVAFAFDGNELTWDSPHDPDVDHYLVFRAEAPDFGQAEQVARVETTTWTDSLERGSAFDYFYWVVAVDHSGNQGEPTDWSSAQISGAEDQALPRALQLHGAAPNPFNPQTTIKFDLPRTEHVRLAVYSVDGRLVATLVNENKAAGRHQIVWSGTDAAGRSVASGTYVYRLTAGDRTMSRTMTLLK